MYSILFKILTVLIRMNGRYFSHSSPLVVIPALRTVGNLVSGDDAQAQVLLDTFFLHIDDLNYTIFI